MLSLKKDKEFLAHFITSEDVPSWYRGISPFQIEAADQLLNSIRDDIEQDTCHRVHQCLNRLGLVPTVPKKDLKILMKLSGGNDLAFLWFLMELYYKTSGEEYSSLNEQLILTSIAHLDMITTLRELDRILPAGHASKRQLEQRRKRSIRNKNIKINSHRIVKKHSSPYFDQLERPVPYGKPLHLERPDFKVRFFHYDIYKDPNYAPANEENRWYATHFFQKAKRITTKTIQEYLTDLMATIDFFPATINEAVSIIDLALEKMIKDKPERTLCKKHEQEEEQRKIRLEELVMEHRRKCLKSLELFAKKKQLHLENVQKMLEKEVEMYRLQYRQKLRDHLGDHSYIRVMGKDDYCEHLIRDDKEEECFEIKACPKSSSAESLKNVNAENADIAVQSDEFRTQTTAVQSNVNAERLLSKNHRLSFGHKDDIKSQLDNFFYGNVVTPPSSERFFERPTGHKPHQFNYPKIFHYKDENDERIFIKEKCVEALDGEPKNVARLVDQTPDLGKLAKKCAAEIWNENHQEWNEADKARKSSELSISVDDPYPPDMPRLQFYDCEDKKLMSEMLRIALLEMSKHPKFVLASLPNAHKLPLLREWIYQRYGKRYTHSQLINEVNISIKIMNTLGKLKLKTKLPKPTSIGKKFQQNYGCHKHIMEKVNMVRRRFYNRVNSDLITQTRYFWFAMRSFLCVLPLPATFFAYFPSRKVDNYLFKPWKLGEYMDAKTQWEQRRLKKKIEMNLDFK